MPPIIIPVCGDGIDTYVSGIITAEQCCNKTSHSVELVGIDAEKQAYIVRNSWGPDWGVAPFPPYNPAQVAANGTIIKPGGGYFLLAYGENTCGVATAAFSVPKVELLLK